MKELLHLKVTVLDTQSVIGANKQINMVSFGGSCEGPLFKGNILPGGVDTQAYEKDAGTISARYMLSGTDYTGKPCRLYIDNRAVVRSGQPTVTQPRIVTDSEALAWLETASLTGTICDDGGGLTIRICAAEAAEAQPIAIRRAGLTLRGRLARKTEAPCPLVLLLHGFTGQMPKRDDEWMQQLSDRLTEMGCATLMFDFNGHGQSDGALQDMTIWSEIEDAAAALQYARQLPWVTEISVVGHSMGGVVAGMLSGLYADVIKKAVLVCPAASLKEDAQKGQCMGTYYNPHAIAPTVTLNDWVTVGGLLFREGQCLPLYEITAQFAGDMLLLCGALDTVVGEAGIRRYLEGGENRRLIRYEKLGHGMDDEESEKQAMLQEMLTFLTRA